MDFLSLLQKSQDQVIFFHILIREAQRGEWPSGLNTSRQVTEVKLGRVRSDSGSVSSGA